MAPVIRIKREDREGRKALRVERSIKADEYLKAVARDKKWYLNQNKPVQL